MATRSVWDFINSINNKNYIDVSELSGKSYNQYIINNAFSYYPDTIFYVNELNKYGKMSNRDHYNFLFFGVPAKKRWSSWNKQDKKVKDLLSQVAQAFNINMSRAKSLIQILDDGQMKKLEEQLKGLSGK